MSYVNRPENWKYSEEVRDKRLLYTSIYSNLAIREGLDGHNLRVTAAEHFRRLTN